MKLATLKRYAKASAKAISANATKEGLDSFVICGKRSTGIVKALARINAIEPIDSQMSLERVFKKWGKV